MKSTKHVRGRPKGTGIDDEVLLREIARLSLADPELRPTTAIKQLGHSNPSTIRRVRDKFKVRGEQIMLSLKRQASELEAAERTSVRVASHKKRSVRASSLRPDRREEHRHEGGSLRQADRSGLESFGSQTGFAGRWAAVMFENQLAIARCAITHPIVTFMLEQQAEAINAMFAFCVVPPTGVGRLREANG